MNLESLCSYLERTQDADAYAVRIAALLRSYDDLSEYATHHAGCLGGSPGWSERTCACGLTDRMFKAAEILGEI